MDSDVGIEIFVGETLNAILNFFEYSDLKVYKVESGTGTWLTLLRAADGATSMSTLDGESF